ncbi:redoxin family protein [Streptococcus cuniculi]|uniref:Redoxin domain-containing protein n=1 Tax=Streptococcus cuniculi TaxID=1432788 RepID=A0A4Y9J7I0_9STRE|nr:redoxin family protein [Streptococcus cuniculi]MBF0779072.1 redoxin family protein [Streptococcus cuniculi]TFU96970.1 redoxin domain-containing protein [Streptococcus cuniculi]
MKTKTLLLASLLSVGLLIACSDQKADDMKKTDDSSVMQKEDKMSDEKKDMNDEKMPNKEDMKKDDMKEGGNKAMNDGKPAPDFNLEGVDGKTYKLSDFKGKKVYLKFWASWCSICLSTLQDTDDLASQVEDEDYIILTVVSPDHMGEKSAEDFKKWYDGLDYKHTPVLLDPSGKLLQEYGVRAYPTSAFIGSDGGLVEVHPGFMDKAGIEDKLKEIH